MLARRAERWRVLCEGVLREERPEAVKIGLALFLVWLVLTNYPQTVVAAFLGTFVVTMLIFAMAFFVRDY